MSELKLAKKGTYDKVKSYMQMKNISLYTITPAEVERLDKKFKFKSLFHKSNELSLHDIGEFKTNVHDFIKESTAFDDVSIETGRIGNKEIKLLTFRAQDLNGNVNFTSNNFVDEVLKAFAESLKDVDGKSVRLTKTNQKIFLDKDFKFDWCKFDEHKFGSLYLYTRCKACLPMWNPSYIKFTDEGYDKLKKGMEVEYVIPLVMNNEEGEK